MTYREKERTVFTSVVDGTGRYSYGIVNEKTILAIMGFVYKNKYCSGVPSDMVNIENIMALEIKVEGSFLELDADQIWIYAEDYVRLNKKLLK